MKTLIDKIDKVKDPAIKEALAEIAKEIQKIKSINPVGENLPQIAQAINRITGKL